MRAVAFYLPQYHAIPENSAIYGEGFTEWDNVRRAAPLFQDHYQPHVPHHTIGYYNLLDEKFLVFQHELAREYGIGAFCYYYYNFSGKRLLEKPVDIINRNRTIKNDFCLCWDHNSWYDNHDNERRIFLKQVYSPANALQIFDDLCKYFENDRYIKIDGKPFVAVFAPERNPLIRQYAEIWRRAASKRGLPGLWLAGVEAFTGRNPAAYGFDSMIEYAPNWHQETLLSQPGYPLRVFDYPATVRIMAAKEIPGYIRNRCIFPGWDNTPRRGNAGALAVNNTPEMYKVWIEYAAKYTQACLPANMRYLFINAWNEWGEGCHLEPDEKNGFSLLRITRDIMARYQD